MRTRWRQGKHRMAGVVTVALAAVFLAGCTGGGASGSGPAATPDAGVPSAPADAGADPDAGTPEQQAVGLPEILQPLPLGAGTAAALADAGFDGATAASAAEAVAIVDVVSPHEYVVEALFPGGEFLQTRYRLFSAPASMLSQPPVVTGEQVSDEVFAFRAEFALDPVTLPDDLRASVLADLPTAQPAASTGGMVIRPAAVRAEDGGAIGMVVDGLQSQGIEFVGDKIAEAWKSFAGGPTLNTVGWEVYKSANKVGDAVGVSDAFNRAMAKLASLEECAREPQGEFDVKEYERNPGRKQQNLDLIEKARLEIKADAAVGFIGVIGDAAGGLAAEAPWLGFVTGPASNYIRGTMQELIDSRIAVLEAQLPKCLGWTVNGNYGQFTLRGTKCGGLAGTWKSTGEMPVPGGTLRVIRTAEIKKGTLKGPFLQEQIITVGGQKVVTKTRGRATLIGSPDGSVTIDFEYDGSGTVTVPGRSQSFELMIPQGADVWRPDPKLAKCN